MTLTAAPGRIAALDFLRGVAVLGILAINITGFWGPKLATFSPLIPAPESGDGSLWAQIWFGVAFFVFEGKMRALFTLLFGASMVLFDQAAQRRGLDPARAQLRRLFWLMLAGYAHYALLWWGDILLPYALCGVAALLLMRLSVAGLLAIALPIFILSHTIDLLLALAGIASEQGVLAGTAAPAAIAEQTAMATRIAELNASDQAILGAGFIHAVVLKLGSAPLAPFKLALSTFSETMPLMLIGMALLRAGFFTGWSARTLAALAAGGIGLGGGLTAWALYWLASHHWPPRALFAAIEDGMAVPHLLMALGYAAGLVALFPRVAHGAPARALIAAGRCAFTNYIGTSVAMVALFSGWGLGLGWSLDHAVPRAALPLFVLAGWCVMLAWSGPWLARFGQGPLEAGWRRLSLPTGVNHAR